MTFTAHDVLTWMLIYLNYFVIAKIIMLDKVFSIKECIYVFVACLLMTISAVVGIAILDIGGALSGIVSIVLCMIYFNKMMQYSFKKTATLTFLTIFIVALNDSFIMLFVDFFFPEYLSAIPHFPLPIGLSLMHFIRYFPYWLFSIITSAIGAFLFAVGTKKQREHINKSGDAQVILAGVSIFIMAVLVLVAGVWRNLGGTIEFLSWIAVPLSGIVIAVSISILFYARSLNERMALRQKEAEQEILRQYTTQIEEQQGIVSKMQHDIGNILSSMEGYLGNDDLQGLKEYFYTKVKAATADITDNNLALARLANIKLPEIKAILAAKLSLAQSEGVDTNVEASDIVDHIAVDSIALVRMLGIIMDNAIEELVTIGTGQLMVACYVVGGGVTFIVQNTCRHDIKKLHELEQVGFSTKGAGRGRGLSNLAEIANDYPDNITLQTSIEGGNFTQKLRIGSTR